jgi:hypothetical protein
MDEIQLRHERAIGDAFVDWYNKRNGTGYQYHDRGADPPDLIYKDGGDELQLEITVAYYDPAHATMLWKNARSLPDAPGSWSTWSPDAKLAQSISLMLAKKAAKHLPQGCVIVVALYPDLISATEFSEIVQAIKVPSGHGFAGIYVGGLFPASSDGSQGGYCWWPLSS